MILLCYALHPFLRQEPDNGWRSRQRFVADRMCILSQK